MRIGRVLTPLGEEINGFEVTIGGVTDPALIQQSYDDINAIFHSNPDRYKVTEEHDENGHFKRFVVQT